MTKRTRLGCRILLAGLLLLGLSASAAQAQPSTILLDGVRDELYVLVATDPLSDLPTTLPPHFTTDWADMSALYAYTTTAELYVYVDLPNYTKTTSSGEIGLAIDTTGDTPNSGGAADPWANPITYTYTSTHNSVGGLPITTTHVVRPDVVIRGNVSSLGAPSGVDVNNGWTELLTWDGHDWTGRTVNWGGIGAAGQQVGTYIAYADTKGVELKIPLEALGDPWPAQVHLQFYTTQKGLFASAYDTLPSEPQSTNHYSHTMQRRLATVALPAPPVPPAVAFSAETYQAEEGVGAFGIPVVASGSVTQAVSVTVRALPGTATALDFTPITSTLVLSPSLLTRPFTVTVWQDDEVEANETILLSLSGPINAVLGQPASAVLNLIDDDAAQPPLWRILLPFIRR
jgi:hypothetical protein